MTLLMATADSRYNEAILLVLTKILFGNFKFGTILYYITIMFWQIFCQKMPKKALKGSGKVDW